MINYTVLGHVMAWQDSWTASLLPQHQLVLAILVVGQGGPVSRETLAGALWEDAEDPPEHALTRVVSELRKELRKVQPTANPLPARGNTYSLPLARQQVDVLRFRSKITQADRSSGREADRLRREAMEEWGDNAIGLFGGQPLTGLRGRWADSKRADLRREYCDARLHCLKQEFDDHQYDRVVGECVQLANEPDALHEEKFVALWMIATYRLGGRSEALKIYQRARESAQTHLGLKPSAFLCEIAEIIRVEDKSRLNGPTDLLGLASATHSQPPVTQHESTDDMAADSSSHVPTPAAATDQEQDGNGQSPGAGADGKAHHDPGTGPSRKPGAGSGGRSRSGPDRKTVKNKVDTIVADKVIFGFEAPNHD